MADLVWFRISLLVIFINSNHKQLLNKDLIICRSPFFGTAADPVISNEYKALAVFQVFNLLRAHFSKPILTLLRHLGNTVILTGNDHDVTSWYLIIYKGV